MRALASWGLENTSIPRFLTACARTSACAPLSPKRPPTILVLWSLRRWARFAFSHAVATSFATIEGGSQNQSLAVRLGNGSFACIPILPIAEHTIGRFFQALGRTLRCLGKGVVARLATLVVVHGNQTVAFLQALTSARAPLVPLSNLTIDGIALLLARRVVRATFVPAFFSNARTASVHFPCNCGLICTSKRREHK